MYCLLNIVNGGYKMKNYILGFTIIIAVLLSVFIIYRVYVFPRSIESKIFLIQEKNSINQFLGILPSSYKNRFVKTVVDVNGNKNLIRVIDKQVPFCSEYYFVQTDNEIELLKSPVVADVSTNSVNWNNHVTFLINLRAFNDFFCKGKQSMSRKDIINKYLDLLSSCFDSTYLFNTPEEAKAFIKDSPKEHLETLSQLGYKVINITDIDNMVNDTQLCWLPNKGLVGFSFVYNGFELVEVTSNIIGCVGDEYINY